ncbi:hypothetical protein C6P45_004905 [Maudiozyma exigua]|uniref:Uncharacterized protein n=1 Tax=Maudiozyma exigua TaxID=34358 RepID=A0A9P6W9L2_MAUEX|nr:hypothetical protein C6P45_004905 [Kazachstania exigua]
MDLLVGRMERKDREGVPAFLSMGAQHNKFRMDKLRVPSVNGAGVSPKSGRSSSSSLSGNPVKLAKSSLIAINDVPIKSSSKLAIADNESTSEQERSMINLQRYFTHGYDENAMESDSESEGDTTMFASKQQSHQGKINTGNNNTLLQRHSHEPSFDYSAAGSGRFSDLEFNFHLSPKTNSLAVSGNRTPNRIIPKVTPDDSMPSPGESRNGSMSEMSSMNRRSSMFLSTPNSAFLKNGRSMSSHFSTTSGNSNKKRLVNQFLKPSEMENESNQVQYHSGPFHNIAHRPSTISSSSGFSSSLHGPFQTIAHNHSQSNDVLLRHRTSNDSLSTSSSYSQLQNVLYKDLDSSAQLSAQGAFPWASKSDLSSAYSSMLNIEDVKKEIEQARPLFRTVDYNGDNDKVKIDSAISPDGLRSKQVLSKDKDELKSSDRSLYFEKHIDKSLTDVQSKLRDTFQNSVIQEELKFSTMLQHFDKLTDDYRQVNESIKLLKDTIESDFNNNVREKFNLTDEKSFQCQMDLAIGDCVKDLQLLEKRMRSCQEKLACQKDTIKRLDNLLVVENSLMELDKNTHSVQKYKYIVCDIVLVSLFAAIVMFCINTRL